MRFVKWLGLAGLALSAGVHAQGYPTKPVYLYIPSAAGGPTDTLGRNLAQAMGKPLKQQVVDKLVAALQESIKDADFRANLAKPGAEPVSADRAKPESLHTLLAAEIAKWGPIIKKAGQYAD